MVQKKCFKTITTLLLALLMTLAFVPSSRAASNDPLVFDIHQVPLDDPIDQYDTFPKTVNFDGNPCVAASYNTVERQQRYGAHLRNASDRHYYQNSRFRISTEIQYKYINIFAGDGVQFNVYDHENKIVANQNGKIGNNDVVAGFRKSYPRNMNFYFINLKESTNVNASKYYVELYTAESTPQSYSLWMGQPLLAKGCTQRSVTQTAVKTVGSSGYSGWTSHNITSLPGLSWLKSITFIPTSESGRSGVSMIRYETTPPNDTRTYMTSTNTYRFPTNGLVPPAYGTYKFQLRCFFSRGSTRYSNTSDVYIQYYYPYGSYPQPDEPDPFTVLNVDVDREVVTGFSERNFNYQYYNPTNNTWNNIALDANREWDVSSLFQSTEQLFYVRKDVGYNANPVELPAK